MGTDRLENFTELKKKNERIDSDLYIDAYDE